MPNKVIAGVLGLIAIFATRYVLTRTVRNLANSATTDRAVCVTMLGTTTSIQDGFTYITGSIKNNCNETIGHVTIAFKLDTEAAVYAYSNDIQPGESRRFKTATHIAANATYRLDGIRAY